MKRALFVLFASLLAVTPAFGKAKRVLLCFPGGPGSTADAQPVVDRFLRATADAAGWEGATGAYYNDMTTCTAELKAHKADLVILPLDLYLQEQERWTLQPVCVLKNKETSGRYHVLAKEGTTLQSLAKQPILTGLKLSVSFLSRVALGGKLDLSALKRTRSPIRAIKNVAKGKAVAAIINDSQWRALRGKPMGKGLTTILSGPQLPGAIVAGLFGAPKNLTAALQSVCKKDPALCADMRITDFEAADTARLKALQTQLNP